MDGEGYHPRLVRLLRWLHFAFARPQPQWWEPRVACRAVTRLVDFVFTISHSHEDFQSITTLTNDTTDYFPRGLSLKLSEPL